tara:strand:+ start:2925 stop:3680 length:756 start_codon:yes stop_codon:yes gene_type:complete
MTVKFEIQAAGKFKLSMSRISKVTSNAIFTLYNHKYTINFEHGILENYGINIVDGCVPNEGLSFVFSTIKFHNLFKNFKGGSSLLCSWDLKKNFVIKPIKKTIVRSEKFEKMTLKTTVKPVSEPKVENVLDEYFDFELLQQETLPGSINLQQIIWTMEKLVQTFENVNLSFSNQNIKIYSENDFYSCESNIEMITTSNITNSIKVSSENLLNILWITEFTSDKAFIFVNPKTLQPCVASTCEDNNVFIMIR